MSRRRLRRFVTPLLLIGVNSCASFGHRECPNAALHRIPGRSAIAWQLNSDRGEIRGRVLDLVGQRPIHDAQVRLRRASRFAVPDSFGAVSFRGVPVGPETLAVIVIDHAPIAVPIELPTDSGVTFVATMALLPRRLNYATTCTGANAP